MAESKRILLISAHPDDMEIGMGGTVAKMATAGDELTSVVFTDGRRAPDPFSIGPEKMVEARKAESLAAAEVLGIRESISFGFEAVATDEAITSATDKLIQLIDSLKPDEVYTLHPELDRHPSHRIAGKIAVEALQQRSGEKIPLWAYEVWGLFPTWDRSEDITEFIETKKACIAAHASQVAAVPYVDGVIGLNRWRAVFADPHQSKTDGEYAEVFIKLN